MNGEWIEDPALSLRMRLWDEDDTAVGEVEPAPGGHIGTHLHPRQTDPLARLAWRRRRKAGADGAAEGARR
jgi:hypothetical protein